MNKKQTLGGMVPPYVPFLTFRNFSESLHHTPPPVIDRKGMMKGMSGTLQTQLLSALRYLHLTDENNVVSPLYLRFLKADSKEKPKILREILEGAYPYLFDSSSGFDLSNCAESQFDKKFAEAGADGATGRKCQIFFLRAAQEAGVSISPHIQAPKNRGKSGRSTRSRNGQSHEERKQIDEEKSKLKRPADIKAPLSFVEAIRALLTISASADKWSDAEKELFVQLAESSVKSPHD